MQFWTYKIEMSNIKMQIQLFDMLNCFKTQKRIINVKFQKNYEIDVPYIFDMYDI